MVEARVPELVAGTPIPQSISVTATGDATIEAAIISASVSLGIGGTAGVGVAVGTSYAKNEIGANNAAAGEPSGVFAKIDDASLSASDDITVSAQMTSDIDAFVGSFSVALAGGFVGVSGAGAGAFADNTIDYAVMAEVDDSTLDAGGTVSVVATDMATIDAKVDSASVALAAASSPLQAQLRYRLPTTRSTTRSKLL
ncbi:hypothetical protein QTO30_13530 [Yoonia sp. GPGPB17]